MTTKPLPPLFRPRKLFENDDHIVVGFVNDDMLVYATQARASLEAENKRLRDALKAFVEVNGMPAEDALAMALSALERKP